MGITLFIYSEAADAIPDHSAPHSAVVLLGQNILWVCFISVFVNEVVKKIDRARYPHSKPLDAEAAVN